MVSAPTKIYFLSCTTSQELLSILFFCPLTFLCNSQRDEDIHEEGVWLYEDNVKRSERRTYGRATLMKLEATTILLSRSASFKPIEGSALIEVAGCTYRRR